MLLFWEEPDARVVGRVLSGQHNDFAILVERYLPVVQAIARGNLINPADTEDVTQESFTAAFQKLDSLRAPQRFGPWLIAIVRNTARSWSRKQGRETSIETMGVEEPAVPPPAVENEEMRRLLDQTLAGMDAERREILMLHYYAGKSLREIAGILNISREAAAKRLQRARETLGGELLKFVPQEKPGREALRARAKVIASLVVAAPVAWQATPAYAATALGMGAVVKLMLTAGVLVGATATVYLSAPQLFSPETAESAAAEAAPESAVPTPESSTAKATETGENSGAAKAVDADAPGPFPPTGTEKIECQLVDLQDRPIPNAEVYLELVNWAATEMPPNPTARWTTQADTDGKFTFENLPKGPYCITAFTPGMGGANDANIAKEHGYTPRNVKMYPIMACSGVVHDETGAPVAGAVLYPVKHVLFPDQEFDHWEIASTRATADSEGKFAFKGLIPGGWILYVVAPDRQPTYTEPVQVPSTNAEVVLGGPGSLAGRVVDARDGEPMPYVKIALVQGDSLYVGADDAGAPVISERVRHVVQSGEDGTFRADGLMPGQYRVRVEDPMLCLADPKTATRIETGKETPGFEVRVSTGGLIAGHVTDKVTGAGIAGVEVSTYSAEIRTHKESKTDSSGKYLLAGLPSGQYRVNLYSQVPGYLRPDMTERSVQVVMDKTQEGVDFTMEPGVTVSGVVVDADGNPVEGAEVSAQANEQDYSGYSYDDTKTDAAGYFVLTRLRGDAELRLDAVKEDWKAKTYEGHLEKEGLADLTLRLDILAGSVIEGKVRDSDGKPLGMAQVTAKKAGEEHPVAGAEAEMNGSFQIKGLQAGRYILTATPSNGNMYRTGYVLEGEAKAPETIVDVAERKTVKDVVVRSEIAGNLTITGKVLSPDGKPMLYAALTVEGLPRYSTVKLNGSFEIDGLQEGSYTVYAAAPGYSPVMARDVKAGTRDLTVRLERFAILRGRVIDVAANAPLDAFTVEYTAQSQVLAEASPGLNGEQSFTDAKGEFRIEGMSTLPMIVKVRAEGYAPWETQLDGLIGGQENELLVELDRGATIQGFVHDAAGQPLGQVSIETSALLPGYPVMEASAAVTTADGAFELRDVAPGEELRLTASREDFAPTVATVTPDAGRVSTVDVLMQEGGSLRVRAFQNGQKIAEFHVYVHDGTGHGRATSGGFSNDENDYVFVNLPPGELTVQVSVPQVEAQLSRTETVTIVPGQETLLEVEFSGSGVIEGAVTVGGVPPSQGMVILEGVMIASAQLSEQGAFSFEGLPAGEYRIRLIAQDTLVAAARLDRTIALGEGDRQRVDWNLDGGGGIRGAVSGMEKDKSCSVLVMKGQVDAQALVGQSLDEEAMKDLVRYSQVDTSGNFEVGYLEPGTYTVIAFSHRPGVLQGQAPLMASQVISIADGQTSDIQLTLQERRP